MSVMIENSNLIECGKCDHDHASEEECTAAEPNNITQRCYDELENFLSGDDDMLYRLMIDDDLDLEEEIGYLITDEDLDDVDYDWIEKKLKAYFDEPKKQHTCLKNGVCHIYMATELEFRINFHKHKGICSEHWNYDDSEGEAEC